MAVRNRRHERGEERREARRDFRAGGNAFQYQMREKLVSIGDDFWIEDSHGQKAFKVDGKAFRGRKTLIFEDPQGAELVKIQDRPVRIRESTEFEGPDGSNVATVKKAVVTPLRERLTVAVSGESDLEVQGAIVDDEYEISAGRDEVAEVSKKWFRTRDTYGFQVEPGQNVVLMLAITVAVDMMAR